MSNRIIGVSASVTTLKEHGQSMAIVPYFFHTQKIQKQILAVVSRPNSKPKQCRKIEANLLHRQKRQTSKAKQKLKNQDIEALHEAFLDFPIPIANARKKVSDFQLLFLCLLGCCSIPNHFSSSFPWWLHCVMFFSQN